MTKIEAQKIGRDMKSKLGKGWKIRVSEDHVLSLGWHVNAKCYNLQIYAWKHENVVYFNPLLGERDSNSGACFWTTEHELFTDPRDAVKCQMKVAEDFVKRVTKVVANLKKVVNET